MDEIHLLKCLASKDWVLEYQKEISYVKINNRNEKGGIMKKQKMSSLALILVLGLILFIPAGVFGQDEPKKAFSPGELDQMLAPVALYPDSLLAQVLMASTYPIEIVQADRFAKKNKDLKGDKLLEAAKNEDWDPTVKSLIQFPDVLVDDER